MDYSLDPLLSPSKAAQAASLSRAWSEVTAFLAPLFYPKPIPHFERNEATLSALFALASHSESQTEHHALLASTRGQALNEFRELFQQEDPTASILSAIEAALDPSARQALSTLASLSTALGSISVSPETMASSLVNLTRSECEVEQQLQRVEALHQQLKSEHVLAQALLSKLRSDDDFQTPRGLVQKTGEWTRGTKQVNTKLGEYKERVKRLERASGGKPQMGIPEIKGQERELRDLEKRVRGLEGRVRGFEGLPPDRELALLEVERMRRELEGLVRRRDGLFEGLVEGGN